MNYRILAIILAAAGLAAEDSVEHLSATWDSNAQVDSDPDAVAGATAVYAYDAVIDWHPIMDDRDAMRLGIRVAGINRPQLEDIDTFRLGLSAGLVSKMDGLVSEGSLDVSRYWLNGKGAEADLRGCYTLGREDIDSADSGSLSIGLIHVDADNDRPDLFPALDNLGRADDDRSGVLVVLAYTHRWIQPGIEVGIRAGRFTAHSDPATYVLLQPFAALLHQSGAWVIQAQAWTEGRTYDSDERSLTTELSVSADYRFSCGFWDHSWWIGGVVSDAVRRSSLDGRDYERWQAGIRLSVTKPCDNERMIP